MKHNGDYRGFIQLSRAWYAEANLVRGRIDEIHLGFYSPEGGTSGEFSITWQELGGKITPRLCAFDDAWSALHNFSDVLERLAELDNTDPSPEQICEILKGFGIRDDTPTISPYK